MMMTPATGLRKQPQTTSTFSAKPVPQQSLSRAAKPAPHFSGPASNGLGLYRKLLNKFDFRSPGTSYLNQIQVIYAGCIGWRLIAANERRKDSPTKSWNEVRENALRDSMGYLFWFFATPMLQRGILAYVTKKHDPSIGNSLYKVNKDIANGKGFMGRLKAWNPLYRVDIPSSDQVKNQMKQALQHLSPGTEAYKKTQSYYNKLSKYRNIATGLGLINTIALIGIGINLLNFYLTRKNMERRKAAMQRPEFPGAPPLPKLPSSKPEQEKPAAAVANQPFPAPPTFPAARTTPTQPFSQQSPASSTTQPLPGNPWGLQPQAG